MALTVVPAYFAATVNLEVSINLETSSILHSFFALLKPFIFLLI